MAPKKPAEAPTGAKSDQNNSQSRVTGSKSGPKGTNSGGKTSTNCQIMVPKLGSLVQQAVSSKGRPSPKIYLESRAALKRGLSSRTLSGMLYLCRPSDLIAVGLSLRLGAGFEGLVAADMVAAAAAPWVGL